VRVAFLGTPSAAVPALDALAEAGHDVVAAVTQPDRPSGRRLSPRPPPVKARALERGIPVHQPLRAKDGALREILEAAVPEVLVVVAYGKILPNDVLEVAPLGAVNVHFSLLPAYRGAAPVQWALAHGESRTGVTTMRIEEGLDTGAIYLASEVAIEEGEHAPALQGRLATVGAGLLLRTLDGLARGALEPRAQDHSLATAAPILTRSDGALAPTWTARQIEGRVRGFDPWPGVWARRANGRIRLVDVRASAGAGTGEPPGRVFAFRDGEFLLSCAEKTVLAVRAVQPDGKRVLRAADARNGRQLAEGDLLESPHAEG
jgi:methionyl-tRNA formyltransferase